MTHFFCVAHEFREVGGPRIISEIEALWLRVARTNHHRHLQQAQGTLKISSNQSKLSFGPPFFARGAEISGTPIDASVTSWKWKRGPSCHFWANVWAHTVKVSVAKPQPRLTIYIYLPGEKEIARSVTDLIEELLASTAISRVLLRQLR